MKFTLKKITNVSLLLGELFIVPCIGANGASKSSKKGGFAATLNLGSERVFKELDKTVSGLLSYYVEHFDFKPTKGRRQNVYLPHKGKTIRLVGVSKEALALEGLPIDEWRKLAGDAVNQAKALKAHTIVFLLDVLPEKDRSTVAEFLAEGALLADYEYQELKSQPVGKKVAPLSIVFAAQSIRTAEINSRLKSVQAICSSVNLVRDLVNTPPNLQAPKQIVAAARKIASSSSRISLKVLNEATLRRMGANSLVSVGKGSDNEPYLIHLSYKPRQKSRKQKKIVLVGKGITFDSGGLSLKPAKSMEDMKCDMAGAAAVLGLMRILGLAKDLDAQKHEIHVIVPTAENMINGRSFRPGDVERSLSGKTIEILNTDAEGRLILADALSYSARLKPDVVIDLATLTGACVVALGNDYAGLFSNDAALEQALLAASQRAGERLWPLPLAEEYRGSLESPVADLKNIGDGTAGAIVAALFLREFVPEKAAWAHLDIAGPAFWGKSNEYIKRGGTGFGVRTLLNYLEGV